MNDRERNTLNEAVKEMYQKWKVQGGEHEFYEIAVGHFYGRGMSRQDALLEARKRYPGLYAKYQDRIAAGGEDVLPLVFEKYHDQHNMAVAAK